MSNDMKIAVEKINAEFEEARIQRQEAKRWHTLLSEGVDKNEGWADKRPWVGLTDEEIKAIIGHNHPEGIGSYARELFKQIEAKLREKNT
jgi:hypothetical protein